MTRIIFIFSILILCSNAFSQNVSHFYGTIGDFPIEMELSNDEGVITGWYWYPCVTSAKDELERAAENDCSVV
jgi:hypothetical protein